MTFRKKWDLDWIFMVKNQLFPFTIQKYYCLTAWEFPTVSQSLKIL